MDRKETGHWPNESAARRLPTGAFSLPGFVMEPEDIRRTSCGWPTRSSSATRAWLDVVVVGLQTGGVALAADLAETPGARRDRG